MLYDASHLNKEVVGLFLFNTCLLLCRKSEKPGKWDLRVMIRMNEQVKFGQGNTNS
jgi:hypothetical protein